MTRINLLKHKGKKPVTVDEFKTWIAQLIVDKKGALPDMGDWKKIKEKLDQVPSTVECIDELDMSGVFNWEYDDIEYFMNKIWTSTSIPPSYFGLDYYDKTEKTENTVQMEMTYDIQKENDSSRNSKCEGK